MVTKQRSGSGFLAQQVVVLSLLVISEQGSVSLSVLGLLGWAVCLLEVLCWVMLGLSLGDLGFLFSLLGFSLVNVSELLFSCTNLLLVVVMLSLLLVSKMSRVEHSKNEEDGEAENSYVDPHLGISMGGT